MRAPARDWISEIEAGAPDVVAIWRQIDYDQPDADYSAARMHYRKAVMLDAKNAQAHYNLGFLRQTIDKNPAGAEPLYRAAIAADPDLAAAHFNLATVLMQTEPNSPEIDDEFAKAVDIDPSLSLRVPEREEAGPVGPASS